MTLQVVIDSTNFDMSFRYLSKIGLMMTCLLMSKVVLSQTAEDIGLVLQGGPSPSTRPCDDKKDNQQCLKFRMVFENRGKKPVIIINPTLGFGTGIKEAWVFYSEYGKDPRTYIEVEGSRKIAHTDPTNREMLRSLARSFDSETPPQNLTVVLQPGETFTFDESFLVIADKRITEKEFRATRGKHPVADECDQRGCLRLPSGRKLVYELNFRPFFDDPDFLNKLSARWRSFGILPIGEDGIYTITSETVRGGY